MPLPFKTQLSKEKLLEQAGITDAARSDLVKYIHHYGHDLDEFSFRIRDFLAKSMAHSDRLAFCHAIAGCLGCDMRRAKDRDAFWKEVVEGGNPYRAHGIKWKNGEEDMPLDELREYAAFCLSSEKFKEPLFDGLIPLTKFGIARSLVYIRVHPPKTEKRRSDLPDGDTFPEEMESCWKELRRHPHYRNSNPPNLNQHALDAIDDQYKERFWVEPDQIGGLRRSIEAVPFDPTLTFWFWPFVLLKYATRCKILSPNHKIINKYRSLWNPLQRGNMEVWA